MSRRKPARLFRRRPRRRKPRRPGRSAVLALAILAGVGTAWWLHGAVVVGPWTAHRPLHGWSMRAHREAAARAAGRHRRVRFAFVPRREVAVDVQLAVLAGEDIAFFHHGVMDLSAVREALEQWLGGARLRGASTISQQLAKNLFLTGRRSLWRKIDELRLAWWLERRLGKRRILELYLNVIELGDGIYGVQAAAEYYYGTSAAALTAEQAAGLAATIPSPVRNNPETATESWQERRTAVLARLAAAEKLRPFLVARRRAQGP